jgi:hypothetical protein
MPVRARSGHDGGDVGLGPGEQLGYARMKDAGEDLLHLTVIPCGH